VSLPALTFSEGMTVAGWLVIWSFSARLGWSFAGWLRRRLLSDNRDATRYAAVDLPRASEK